MSIREGAITRSKCWMATSGGYDPLQDNDTSVIRGPAIKKAGWLNSNGAVKHTAACEKSPISGVQRKSTEKPYFKKGCQNKAFVSFSASFYP